MKKFQNTPPIASEMRKKYKKVTVDAIIVGPLGSWDNMNDKVIAQICSKKYGAMLKKLIISEAIRSSRDIYEEHRSGQLQIDYRTRAPLIKRTVYPSQIEAALQSNSDRSIDSNIPLGNVINSNEHSGIDNNIQISNSCESNNNVNFDIILASQVSTSASDPSSLQEAPPLLLLHQVCHPRLTALWEWQTLLTRRMR